jgi:protocatechuate 3,4-dioxygenase beta subunit
MTDPTRRQFLRRAVLGGAGVLLSGNLAYALDPTPEQDLGPFHPLRRMDGSVPGGTVHGVPGSDLRRLLHDDNDNVLTHVNGRSADASLGRLGYVLYVFGTVRGEDEEPIEGADVEIWQACATGRYNHVSQTTGGDFDPDFQYWGTHRTNANGAFLFKTVQPGAYRNDPSWIRPPHIHTIVGAPGYEELTTQFYLTGTQVQFLDRAYNAASLDVLNDRDHVLRNWVASADRSRVISPVQATTDPQLDPNGREVTYEVVLKRSPGSSGLAGNVGGV